MANLADLLRESVGSDKLEAIAALMDEVSGGNPQQFQAQVDMHRGAREGQADPRLGVLSTPADKALADRYAWGADIASQSPYAGPLALIPPMAYEGVKAVAPGLLGAIGKVLPQGEEMQPDASTSPASWDNLAALIAGYLDRGSAR
jgi:hypothetical protein